ncbi:hypothetical protein FHY55_09315 [Oceanicola sp. D3]|uniref:hypothetical protein n=1 Tax=Oceanicola sp. D3 TaxID=2587163 RepID=UPI001123F644|nr:hypothetical protein [Oceanicola sp. D3]QDC09434.1 hypothetical protein FHY55_09315 [Oceanicola sp. D3]
MNFKDLSDEDKELAALRYEWARKGVQYVNSLHIQSTNRGVSEKLLGPSLYLQRRGTPDNYTSFAQIEARVNIVAKKALEGGMGNCDEQSCLAMVYLRKNAPKKIGPVHWIAMDSQFATHALVAIGDIPMKMPNHPNRWPHTAMICDPWKRIWHAARNWTDNQGVWHAHLPVAVLYSFEPDG